MNQEINEFAAIVINRIRDAAIRSSDRLLSGGNVMSNRWRHASENGSSIDFAKVLIPDIVDDTIFHLLAAIDDGILKLDFISSDGKSVDLTSEGASELAGWYMGSGGWRTIYSKERHFDYFSDMK